MASQEDVAKVLAFLGGMYPRFEFPATSAAVYYDMLKDLDPTGLMLAVKKLGDESRFFPTVAEIRQAYFRLEELAHGTPEAGQAWGEVVRQVWECGTWAIPRFSDPLIQRAVDAIGWEAICLSDTIGVERAHFMKIYDQLKERQREHRRMLPEIREALAQLAGGLKSPLLTEGS